MPYQCPLCGSDISRKSWLGLTIFNHQEFQYIECLKCGSIYCSPMPDTDTLAVMYGENYQQFYSVEASHSGDDGVKKVLNILSKQEKGVLFDYGCGAGNLLKEVSALGWKCVGFEFDAESARKYGQLQGIKIVTDLGELSENFKADVIHVGDVLEHLTDLDTQFPAILKFLREGGILIAQGPLDANFNLFLLGLRLKKLIRNTASDMPPYHVTLTTAKGQEIFFERFGLEKLTYSIFEDSHPAPSSLTLNEARNPRLLGLFLLRKASQTISKFSSQMGNRYFYVGRKKG